MCIVAEQKSPPWPLVREKISKTENSYSLRTFARARFADVSCYPTHPHPPTPPLSFYNTLFWYGGASSNDDDELPAMNFQDLLERYDLPAIEQSSARPRVRGGPDQGRGGGREAEKCHTTVPLPRCLQKTGALNANAPTTNTAIIWARLTRDVRTVSRAELET